MKAFFKVVGWSILGGGIWFVWWTIDSKSANFAVLVAGALWFGYRVIQDLIVQPILNEIRDLNRRIDRLDGYDPPEPGPSPFR